MGRCKQDPKTGRFIKYNLDIDKIKPYFIMYVLSYKN